jgi:hypothetical protein
MTEREIAKLAGRIRKFLPLPSRTDGNLDLEERASDIGCLLWHAIFDSAGALAFTHYTTENPKLTNRQRSAFIKEHKKFIDVHMAEFQALWRKLVVWEPEKGKKIQKKRGNGKGG